MNDLLIHLLFPSAGADGQLRLRPEPAPQDGSPFAPLPPPLSTCPILVSGADTAILHRSSLRERKRRKLRKGELPLSLHNLRTDRRRKAGSRIYGRIGSNAICCPKDEDVYRSSWSHTFIPSLSLRGSSSSANTVGKIISFAEAPARLCINSNPYPEKKL